MKTPPRPASIHDLAVRLRQLDREKQKKVVAILKREGVLAGCFSQYCKGTLHAHAPTS